MAFEDSPSGEEPRPVLAIQRKTCGQVGDRHEETKRLPEVRGEETRRLKWTNQPGFRVRLVFLSEGEGECAFAGWIISSFFFLGRERNRLGPRSFFGVLESRKSFPACETVVFGNWNLSESLCGGGPIWYTRAVY